MERAKALYSWIARRGKGLRRRLITWCARYAGTFLSSVKSTIVIVSFLYAVEYFTARSSVGLYLWDEPFMTWYDLERVYSFYMERGLPIPDTSATDVLSPIFRQGTFRFSPRLSRSPEQIVLSLLFSESQGAWSPETINLLQRDFLRPDRPKTRSGSWETDPQHSDTWLDSVLDISKQSLTPRDYLLLVLSFSYGKIYSQGVTIKNTGSTDLTDVSFFIPAPVSRMTGRRENTILECDFSGFWPVRTEIRSDQLVVHIDLLRPGKAVSGRINTTGYGLDSTEFSATYNSSPVIQKKVLLSWFVVVWFAVLLIELLVQRRQNDITNALPRQ